MNEKIMPAAGKISGKKFLYPIRVYYEDTDAGGIVYYANYLKFAERARSEFLRALNINQQKNLEENQTGFIVRSCQIDYLSSAFLDDALTVVCNISELGGASAVIHQEILRDDTLLARLDIKVVYMNIATHRPTRIPSEFIEKFTKFTD